MQLPWAESIFAISILGILYVYAGYPLIVYLFSRVAPRKVRKVAFEPRITVLIAAYDEAEEIEATVRNKLELDYPADRLDVIVVSDGSTDGTDEIVRGIGDPRVRLLRQEPRAGKTSALNLGIEHARGEIVVFSDANSVYSTDALRNLVRSFGDPRVGYVSGHMIYTDPEGSVTGDGCSAYMRYENLLRRFETAVGSVVGVDGGIDAVRRELYREMRPDQLPDFVLPLSVVSQGYRVVYEPEAVLREPPNSESGAEYRMRVRVALRSLWALHDMRHLLNMLRFKTFSWQLWSHKVLRYLAFTLLLAAFVSNLLLLDDGTWFRLAFAVQGACYLAALIAWALERRGTRSRLFYVPYYFTLINVASAHAFFKYIMGHKTVLWTPRKG